MSIQISSTRSFVQLMAVLCLAGLSQAQHIHDQHPTTVHTDTVDGEFIQEVRIEMNEWWGELYVQLVGEQLEVISRKEIGNCNDNPCILRNGRILVNESRTHSITIGGKVEHGVEVEVSTGKITNLFAELKATAHVKVELSASGTVSHTESFSIDMLTPLPPCTRTGWLWTINHFTAQGTQDYAVHRGVCRAIYPNGCNVVCLDNIWYCNFETLTGNGDGYDYESWDFVPAIRTCEDILERPCDCVDHPQ